MPKLQIQMRHFELVSNNVKKKKKKKQSSISLLAFFFSHYKRNFIHELFTVVLQIEGYEYAKCLSTVL